MQEMTTDGFVLCVGDLIGLQRIDGCRSQPVQARTKQARMVEKRKQQWRESEANRWGKEQAGGEGGWAGKRRNRVALGVGIGGPGIGGRSGLLATSKANFPDGWTLNPGPQTRNPM